MPQELEQAGEILATCASRPGWSLGELDLISSLDMLQTLAAQGAALQLTIVGELDGRGVPVEHGAANTSAWLRDRLHISGRTAYRTATLATALGRHAETAAALAAGAVNVEQAAVIAKTLDDLPAETEVDERGKAEAVLLGYAAEFEPDSLRKLGSRILSADYWDPSPTSPCSGNWSPASVPVPSTSAAPEQSPRPTSEAPHEPPCRQRSRTPHGTHT